MTGGLVSTVIRVSAGSEVLPEKSSIVAVSVATPSGISMVGVHEAAVSPYWQVIDQPTPLTSRRNVSKSIPEPLS